MAKNNELPNLEQLIAEEKTEKARQNAILSERDGKKKRNKTLLIGGLVTASVLLVGGVAVYDPFAQNFRWETSPSVTGKGSNGGNGGSSGKALEWWQAKETQLPVTVPEWAKEEAPDNSTVKSDSSAGEGEKDGSSKGKIVQVGANGDNGAESNSNERFARDQAREKLYTSVYRNYEGTTLSDVAIQLPSLEGGYTDDATKAVNENGSLNTKFTFWSRENFVSEVGVMTNRLLNPVFGGWVNSSAQANDATKEKLGDLFTSQWLSTHEASALPIVTSSSGVPVKSVEYLPEGAARWTGKTTSEEAIFSYDVETHDYTVDYTANVTYTSWTADKEKVNFNGVLKLKLVPNSQGQNPNSGNRVLISDASIKLG